MINSRFNVGDEVFVKATVREIRVDENGIKYALDIRETGCVPPAWVRNDRTPYDDIPYSVTARVKEKDIFQSPYPAEGNAQAKTARANYTELYHDQDDLK